MSYQVTAGNGLLHSVYKYPEKTAIVYQDKRITYRALNERVNRLSNGLLALGLKKGEKACVLLNNCAEYLEIVMACAKIGVIVVPINTRFIAEEVIYCVNDSESRFLFTDTELLPIIEPIKESFENIGPKDHLIIGEDVPEGYARYEPFLERYSDAEPDVRILETDLLYIGYTSGTTGKPKGALFSHRSRLFMQGYSIAEFKVNPHDNQLLIMPLFHSNGLVFGLMACTMGSTLVITRPFDPVDFLRLIDVEKINYVSVVPTILTIIFSLSDDVKNSYDLSSLHTLVCSSSPLTAPTREQALDFFKSAELSEFYGSSEAGLVTILHHREAPEKVNCVGRPCLGMNVCIMDPDGNELPAGEVGELYSWGVTFEGYHKNPEATEKAFRGEWLTVGDMAKKDEEGFLYLVDRKQDMIISGAENIYPAEVEEVLAKHPKIMEAAVIGVPDEKWGESVKAVAVLHQGQEATEEEIIEFCKENIARYKCPKTVDFANELPKNLTGKLLRRILREQYQAENVYRQ